jgi:hypothetical protein
MSQTARHVRTAIAIVACLVAGLLVAPPMSNARADTPPAAPQVRIAAPAECGLKNGSDMITFSGGGPSGSSLHSAVLRSFNADGNQLGSDVNVLDRAETVQMNSNGAISGTTIAAPIPAGAVKLRAVLTVIQNGLVSAEGVSNFLPIDPGVPHILGAETSSPSTVVVKFSEDVFARDGDFAADWTVDHQRAARIDGQGAKRTLTLSPLQKLTEDAEPRVEFDWIDPRAKYVDCVGNDLADPLVHTAVDRIAPAIPEFKTIAGKNASNLVASNTDSPKVEVQKLTPGHKMTIYRETSSTIAFDPHEDAFVDEATAAATGTATIENLPAFGTDGIYTLYAVATDVHGNMSIDAGGNPAADQATFVLDRVAPLPIEARSTGTKVTVTFTEPLTGNDDKTNWTITGCAPLCTVATVTGAGDTRVLELDPGQLAPNGASVAWNRPLAGGYVDRADNPLDSFGSLVTQGFIPRTIDLTPEDGEAAAGTSHTLTIAVTDDFGAPRPGTLVWIRATNGPASSRDFDGTGPNPPGLIGNCLTQSNGKCSFSYPSNSVGTDTIQGWIDADGNVSTIDMPTPEPKDDADPDSQPSQDVVDVNWVANGSQLKVDARPETHTGPARQPHIVTVTVNAIGSDAASQVNPTPHAAIENVAIGLRSLSGPNAGFLDSCATDETGICALNYNSTVTGTDQLQAWIDTNRDDVASTDELKNGDERADADDKPLLDQTNQDVIAKTWTKATVLHLNAEPEESVVEPGETLNLELGVLNEDDQPVAGLDLSARVFSGPNAGKNISCRSSSTGTCFVSYNSPAGGTDLIQAWIDLDRDGVSDETSGFEPAQESSGTDDPMQDVVRAVWRVVDMTVTVSPKTASAPVGTTRSFDISVRDKNGTPMQSVPVGAQAVSGPNSGRAASQCTTGFTGTCSISFTSTKIGSDHLQIWAGSATQPTQEIATVDWVMAGADLALDATPETGAAPPGSQYPVSLAVTTPSGAAVEGALIAAKVTDGPNANADLGSCTSNATGACTLKYTSKDEGQDTVLAWIDADRNHSSNEITGPPEPSDATGPTDVRNHDVVHVEWDADAAPPALDGLTLAVSTTKARYRQRVTLSGQILGDCGAPSVELLRRIREGSFQSYRVVTPDANGAFAVVIRPKRNGSYEAACDDATSPARSIRVSASVTADAFRSQLPAGSCTAITGMVRPAKPGARVVLQKRGPFGWNRVDLKRLAGDSSFSFPVCAGSNGTDTYRVKWTGDRFNISANSAAVHIRTR